MTSSAPAMSGSRRSGLATTPGRMAASLAIIAVLALLAGTTALSVMAHIRQAVQTIGADAEPSVVAAQILEAHLAGMDAAALADSLGENGSTAGASQAFAAHLASVDATLVAAARNITYGEAEAAPIRAMIRAVQTYVGSLAETRWMARDDVWLAQRRARWSSRLLNDFTMPDAAALERANLDPLETEYQSYRASSFALAAVTFGAFGLFVASLAGTQVFLFRRTRRLINVPLMAATVLTVLTMAGLGLAMVAEHTDTRAAKEDAFDSLHALYGAKAVAYRLVAARSLWLLDPTDRADSAARFSAGSRTLLGIDTSDVKAVGALIDKLTHALELERVGRPADALQAVPKLGGLLGDELSNVTFGSAERQPATDAVIALVNYLQVDREIVRLDDARRHVEAIMLAGSARPGGSVDAFNTLDAALDRTIAVNQAEFDRRTANAIGLLGWLPWALCGALAAAVGLAAAGIWQRWREYR